MQETINKITADIDASCTLITDAKAEGIRQLRLLDVDVDLGKSLFELFGSIRNVKTTPHFGIKDNAFGAVVPGRRTSGTAYSQIQVREHVCGLVANVRMRSTDRIALIDHASGFSNNVRRNIVDKIEIKNYTNFKTDNTRGDVHLTGLSVSDFAMGVIE